jgi:hypothetical protein
MKDNQLTPEQITKAALSCTARQIVSKLKKEGIQVKTCTHRSQAKHRCGCDIMLELKEYSIDNIIERGDDFCLTQHEWHISGYTGRSGVERTIVHIVLKPTLN